MGATCAVHRLVADVAARSEGKVLFVKYKDVSKYDGQRGWFLPDDFLNWEEHPREAARRILREQAGIATKVETLSHIESFAGGAGGAWHLIFHYTTELPGASKPIAGSNVADAKWFPLSKLPPRKDVSHGGWALDVLKEALG